MMNKYRSIPGMGPQKASATTTCQKCLKKGHYSYECKSSLQERPYISRPSRTEQFRNPKLAPKLTNTKPSEPPSGEGVADQILAEAEAKRKSEAEPPSSPVRSRSPRARRRSLSASSDSVSTVSTNRSRSPPPRISKPDRRHLSEERSLSRSPSRHRGRKRRYSSHSAASSSSSPPPPPGWHRKSRRHRTLSPDDRGRSGAYRRGSHRSRSGSRSLDKSKIARHRKSLEPRENQGSTYGDHRRGEENMPDRRNGHNARRPDPPAASADRRAPRRERSLSPYSRRLALTQAMNLSR